MFEICEKLLAPHFTEKNWTSNMGAKVKDSRFTGIEKDYSDLTFHDAEGRLTQFFIDRGFSEARDWLRSPPKYHLEVKSTTETCDERFFMSNNQVEMVRLESTARRVLS